MTLVVEFRAKERQAPKAESGSMEASAEIIIFPGVRFERLETEPELPEPRTPDRRVRANR